MGKSNNNENDYEELETITITFEDGIENDFYVLESTTLNEINYYLVMPVDGNPLDDNSLEDDTDTEDDEMECYILKENTAGSDEEYGMYSFVEDEDELEGLSKIFDELLDDSDMEVKS